MVKTLPELKADLVKEAKKVLKKDVPSKPIQTEVTKKVIEIFNQISRLAESLTKNKYTEQSQLNTIKETFQYARIKTYSVFKKTQTELFVPKEQGEFIRELQSDEIQTDCETLPDEDEEALTEEEQRLLQTAKLSKLVRIKSKSQDSLNFLSKVKSQDSLDNISKANDQNRLRYINMTDNYDKLIDITNKLVREYDGKEENLATFETQIKNLSKYAEKIAIADRPDAIAFMCELVKGKITGNLRNSIKNEDNTFEKIITKVTQNVFKMDAETYENILSCVIQRRDQSTTDFATFLEKKARVLKRVYDLELGTDPRDSNGSEKRVIKILRKNLMEKAKDARVRRALEAGSFNKIDEVIAKLTEFPFETAGDSLDQPVFTGAIRNHKFFKGNKRGRGGKGNFNRGRGRNNYNNYKNKKDHKYFHSDQKFRGNFKKFNRGNNRHKDVRAITQTPHSENPQQNCQNYTGNCLGDYSEN